MKADFTRLTFKPEKHYSSVRMQQGRVQLDADWNEQVDITAHRVETETADVVGLCGAPLTGGGFEIDLFINNGDSELTISAGRIYVGGLLCELDSTPVAVTGVQANGQKLKVDSTKPDGEKFRQNQWVEVFGGGQLLGRRKIAAVDDENRQLTLHQAVQGLQNADGPFVRRLRTYLTQPDYRNPDPRILLPAQERYLVYLDVWQRHLTALQDIEVREVALGGPDTATRTKTVWQVKLEEIGAGLHCDSFGPAFVPSRAGGSTGRLRARTQLGAESKDPCIIPASAGYRRLENQLYRVEIHQGGTADDATFKWSRENGSVAFPILKVETNAGKTTVELEHLGRDANLGLAKENWVELVDDDHALHGRAEPLLQVDEVDVANRKVVLKGTPVGSVGQDSNMHPLLRRWDHKEGKLKEGALEIEEGTGDSGWIDLESGVQIQFPKPTAKFPASQYRTGDYWLIPARANTGDVEWPTDTEDPEVPKDPVAQPPHGIHHHYCPLAILAYDAAKKQWKVESDCRPLFPALTELTTLHYVSGDGQEAMPDLTTHAPVELAQPLVVGVARGWWPVRNALVRFKVLSGSGTLEAAAHPDPLVVVSAQPQEIIVRTGTNGLAACKWRLDATNHVQRVHAALLNEASEELHLPVVFNANLSTADQVAYDPNRCWHVKDVADVQAALDHFCAVRHLNYVSGDGQEGPPEQLLPAPLIAGVTDGLGRPVPGAQVKFEVTSGKGKVGSSGGNLSSSFPGSTNEDGLVECLWELGSKPGQLNVVTAALQDEAGIAIAIPIRFTSSRSGIHVTKMDGVSNDNEVSAEKLEKGIHIVCDAPLDPRSITPATVFLTVRMPTRAGTDTAATVYFLVIVDAEVGLEGENGSIVVLKPLEASLKQLAVLLSQSGRRGPLLARLTLKGNFIWAIKPPGLYLDGDAFGIPAENGKTNLRFPSGDGRPGGDFEMWFWLVTEAPGIRIDPTRLDFGNVEVNSFRDLPLVIRNGRALELQVTSMFSNNPQFTVQGPSSFSVAPRAEQKLGIRFAPGSQTGSRDGTLTIHSNDPNTPSTTVELAGTAVPLAFGTLRGRVFDESTGTAVDGATVIVVNVGTAARREAKTGRDGRYLFERVAPGHYDVHVNSQGFRQFRQTGVLLEGGGTKEVNAALKSEIG